MTETTSRLSVTDWITAGLTLLSEEGIGGVKIQRLCERLGVTKGSFYWHFTDLDAFLGAMAKYYEDGARIFRDRFSEMATKDAAATFADTSNFLLNRRLAATERAMRDWARTDDRARAAIEASDELGFSALRRSFELLGFSAGRSRRAGQDAVLRRRGLRRRRPHRRHRNRPPRPARHDDGAPHPPLTSPVGPSGVTILSRSSPV